MNDKGGPHDPEEPTGERRGTDGADDAPLARVLPFEIPFDGILNCGGDCRYGADVRWLAPVVPIGGRREG